MDIISPERRSALMSRIRGKNTGIELAVRRGLHALGLRYRLGGAGLPGRPDLVFPKFRTVVFVHGCFWHGHECSLFRLPKTRTEFWRSKIEYNRNRDSLALQHLVELGWRSEVVWECQLRGASESSVLSLMSGLAKRIRKSGIR